MNKRYDFTQAEIESAANQAESKTEMMRLLGIRQGGGGYQALDFWCRKYGVTPPNGVSLGKKNLTNKFVAMSNEEWFVNGVRRQGVLSKKRLLSVGHRDECSECGIPAFWNDKPLVLQVDHINGDRWDNRIENLRILCPNCHTQTGTYANTGRRKARNYCECGKEISKQASQCVPCASAEHNVEKIVWPSVEEVVEQVRLTNFSRAAILYKCSDNAIRKFLQRNGVDWKTI